MASSVTPESVLRVYLCSDLTVWRPNTTLVQNADDEREYLLARHVLASAAARAQPVRHERVDDVRAQSAAARFLVQEARRIERVRISERRRIVVRRVEIDDDGRVGRNGVCAALAVRHARVAHGAVRDP